MDFVNALFAEDLVSREMVNELLTPQNKAVDEAAERTHNCGLGLHLVADGEQIWTLMMGNGAGGEAVVGGELNSSLTVFATPPVSRQQGMRICM